MRRRDSVSHAASHDPLTNLPNRLLLSDRLVHALALAHRHQRRMAVLFLDIDRFKQINDSLGHLLGDELLHTVGRELTRCVRQLRTRSAVRAGTSSWSCLGCWPTPTMRGGRRQTSSPRSPGRAASPAMI